jgi:adenosylcobinamide-phosphate guanylyltransferase
MEALVNAGGKGSRMGACGIEKPMQPVGGIPTVMRVVKALEASRHISRVLVSVSDNTLTTEDYLGSMGVETIRTSGESFMDDLHTAFEAMSGEYVLTCPSDLPLLTTDVIDLFAEFFVPGEMESAIAVVDEETVRKIGITPSYTREDEGRNWVLSGICIMNREGTLRGDYLEERLFKTDRIDLSVNVNTQEELRLARGLIGSPIKRRPGKWCCHRGTLGIVLASANCLDPRPYPNAAGNPF